MTNQIGWKFKGGYYFEILLDISMPNYKIKLFAIIMYLITNCDMTIIKLYLLIIKADWMWWPHSRKQIFQVDPTIKNSAESSVMTNLSKR